MPPRGSAIPRFGAICIVIAIAVLIAALPRRYQMVPSWFTWTGVGMMVLPMLLGPFARPDGLWRKIERGAELFAVVTALVFNVCNLSVAAYDLIENPSALDPIRLFYTSIVIWCGNVLIFTLLYWLVDSGGPDARANKTRKYPDFVFPSMEDDEFAPEDWQPGMIDYLFLAFTTSTAFSPTEALPYTRPAKLLMIVQSTISLVTIAIVAARTINILK
jgi:hypothetical protein